MSLEGVARKLEAEVNRLREENQRLLKENGELRRVADLAYSIHSNTVGGGSDELITETAVTQIMALQEAGYDIKRLEEISKRSRDRADSHGKDVS